MARSKLGRKALSVLVATTMVVSLNAPISAWAGNDDATDGADGQTSSLVETQADVDGQEAATHDGTSEANAVTTSDELKAAIGNAQDGATIYLAAGEYTTHDMAKCTKSLTFQGVGNDASKIVWVVGDLSKNVGEEGNGDYSFDGSSQVTFRGMTLEFGSDNYRGFIRIDKTVVENCILNGRSAYWGYSEAGFKDCTFNAPDGDYALWDYSSAKMTFDHCTFNVSGKTVNAYNEKGSDTVRTIVMTNCVVNSSEQNKAVLNLKNKDIPWKVELSGNTVTGLEADQTTGSKLYQVEYDSSKVTATEGKPVQVYEDGSLVYLVKAPGAVAMAGDTQYTSVQDAVNAATEGQTVSLLDDATESIVIPAEKQLTLDLNGKKLTNAAGGHTITNNGTLTIMDTSTAKTGTVDNVTHQRAAVENNQGAMCTILSGNFTRSQEAGEDPNNSGGNSFYYIENFGTMTLGSEGGDNGSIVVNSDGHFSSLIHNGWFDGSKNASKKSATMTINAGTFKGGINTIKNDDYGEVVINGGSFENATQHALYNVNVATVNGGSFESTTMEAVYTVAYDDVMDKGTTTVTGGAFKSAAEKRDFKVVNSGAKPVVSISGGTFSANVPEQLIKSGYASIPSSDGNYVVAKKGAESKDDGNKTSGSVATDGVTVDGQQQIADSAAAAAGAVKDVSVSEGATTANIGGITVDASGDNASRVNEVASAAGAPDASVDVTLVVKAGSSDQPDPKISEKVDASRTAVVPFTLSVDMVTEVKDSNGTVKASATVPVKETAEPIKVTISVDPATIAGKKVTVARVHDGAVEYIDPIDVDYDKGLVVFETGKFSEYAVLATDESISYSLPALDENGVRASVDFNMPEGYAFAGWYKDSGLTVPYDSSAPGGTAAYPKFVKVSDLISFRGGSLRMDFANEDGSANYAKTSLRFGYEMHVPAGATLDHEHWGWTMLNPDNNQGGFVKAQNYWMTDDDGAITNVVVTPIEFDGEEFGYETEFRAVAQVAYVTKDGTSVTVKDQARTRSVKQVAEMILGNAFASDKEITYAQGILAEFNR